MKSIKVCVICSIVFGCEVDGKNIKYCHIDCDRKCTEDGVGDIEQSVCPTCVRDEDWGV